MTKEFWFNLPVKNIKESQSFFNAIGFLENLRYPATDHSASFFIGEKKVVMMLFTEEIFQGFTQNSILDTHRNTEVLFNIDAENKAEVNEMAKKVEVAGGKIYAPPSDKDSWMYGCGFEDLDGHRWNVLYMDMDKMPKQY